MEMELWRIVMKELAFDNDLYLKLQSKHISERIASFGNKLYLEFGGKLFDDHHAARVLPGFQPDSKLKMLLKLRDKIEIVIVVCAFDIEKNKMRSDIGITYDDEVLRLIDAFQDINLFVGSVVITQFENQPSAIAFRKHLENLGVKVFIHFIIPGYPNNVPFIVSELGYGKNDYIETSKELIVVTAPGPGSGKMATCLSQLYHEHIRGIKAGYAKFETFPIWNLPLKHPVNLAYESATADLNDVNMIDPYHLEAYGTTSINYNRDVEVFPVLSAIFEQILGRNPYLSPTDMGVNMAGSCIINDEAACAASNAEIIRRLYHTKVDYKLGKVSEDTIHKIEMIMSRGNIILSSRSCVHFALEKAFLTNGPAVAIELESGDVICGKTTSLLGATASAILNALKVLADIDDDILLISPAIIEPIQKLKTKTLGYSNPLLTADEVLIALAISATTNEVAQRALKCVEQLKCCEAHSTVILSQIDEHTMRKLGILLTCEDQYKTKKMYHN